MAIAISVYDGGMNKLFQKTSYFLVIRPLEWWYGPDAFEIINEKKRHEIRKRAANGGYRKRSWLPRKVRRFLAFIWLWLKKDNDQKEAQLRREVTSSPP